MNNLFSFRAIKTSKLSWRKALECLPVMNATLRTLCLSLTDGLTKEWCIAMYLFWKSCRRIAKRSGWLFLVAYNKQVRITLMKYVGEDPTYRDQSLYISTTRSGIPRIIPSFHRAKIKRRDAAVVQLYMSLLSVGKLIELAPKVSTDTFKTIVTPADLDSVQKAVYSIKPLFRTLLDRYVPSLSSIPLKQGLEFRPTWKAVPTASWYARFMSKHGDSKGESLKPISHKSVFLCFPYELASFQSLMTFVHAQGDQYSQGCLWPPFVRYPFDSLNETLTNWSLEWFEKRIGPYLPSPEQLGVPPIPGRLCAACTGDGKRRVFAIGNYVNQMLLKPVHTWLASVLERIPMDGTFNQTGPLDKLSNHGTGWVHSVDLKAATDRWPLLLMFELMKVLFGPSFASASVNSALACNIFQVAFAKRKNNFVSFIAGQPLGYYSSWPLFALSHHMVVWAAAEQVYPGKFFSGYAVLGDDVVIADTKVRDAYLSIIEGLGVTISVGKSLDSPSGCAEFAKRFRIEKMTRDVSPLSIPMILESKSLMGWYNYHRSVRHKMRLSTRLRTAGLGFKAASRDFYSKNHGRRAKRYIVMIAYMATSSVVLSLAVALRRVLPPYVVCALRRKLIEYIRVREPQLPPDEGYAYPGMKDFLEYSLFRGWMKQYLRYLQWRCELEMKPDVTLDEILSPPEYIWRWYCPEESYDSFKFGITFKLYDWCVKAFDNPVAELDVLKPSDFIEGEGFIMYTYVTLSLDFRV